MTGSTLQKGPAKVEGATVRLPFQRLSFQLWWVRDHREAVLSVEETSDSVVKKGNPFIFREVFHSEIIHAADHRNTCKHEI